MNIYRLSCAALLLITASSLATAQRRATTAPTARAPQTAPVATSSAGDVKIGLVDTSVFGDEKEGIIRFRNAVHSIEAELQPHQVELDTLKTRIDTVAKELNDLSKASVVSQETITAKREEGERLTKQLNEKKDSAQKLFEKRYNEVAGPVSQDIGNALTKFAEQRGITLTLDISKILPAILTIAPGVDLTKEFVADYNSKNPGTVAPKP